MRHLTPDPTLQAALKNLADYSAVFTSAISGGRLVPTEILCKMGFLYNPSADIKTIIVSDRSYKIHQLEDSPFTLHGFGGGLGHSGTS